MGIRRVRANLPVVSGGTADGATTEKETAGLTGDPGPLLLRFNQERTLDLACDALAAAPMRILAVGVAYTRERITLGSIPVCE